MTDKQKQVIQGMRRTGASYASIADSLGLSPNTVKSYCYRNNLMFLGSGTGELDGCKTCGAPLQQREGTKRRIFCSDKCRYTWWNRNRAYMAHQKIYHLTCLGCGTTFKSYGNKNRKYCGRECYINSRYDQSTAGGEGLP